MVLKKKAATGSMGYVVMFTMALLMVVLTLYMAQVARLMTHQHHVDDSLADSVLASLVVAVLNPSTIFSISSRFT